MLRNGDQYLAALRDGRRIVWNGQLVEDVTTAPGFRHTARSVAQFYDFQCQPEMRDVMTYETPEGERAGMAFIEPRSKEDLRRRGAAYAAWAEVTCGLMGRSPDYMNSIMMALGAAWPALGATTAASGDRAYAMYLDARRRDLSMTHTFVSPFVDRFKRLSEQPGTIRVVRETPDGPVISGARGVATNAPFSDANLSLHLTQVPVLAPGEEAFAVCFTVPVNAPGVRWFCRDPYDAERSHFDAPLSGKVDEMDCVAVFEECLLPWDNLFIYRDIDVYNRQADILRLNICYAQQVLAKNIAKTRFLYGLAHLIAESSQIGRFINVQERLGEFAIHLDTLESLAIAMVEGAEFDEKYGIWFPNKKAAMASLRLYPEYYASMMNHLMQLGASGYVGAPQERTFEKLGTALEDYFRTTTTTGPDKVALFRMAWDVVGSGWGRRQELYERFFSGDLQRWKAFTYLASDKSHAVSMVERLLKSPPTETQPFPWPKRGG
jgi:4-hydroxyphenylacetate 3-monooxygenase